MNREELFHVAICQWLLVLATVVSSAFFGLSAALSAAMGGMCVAIPNSLVVLNLLVSDVTKRPVAPVMLLVMEFLKILATCLLLVLTAVLFSGLVWPALIFGIIAAALSMLLLPIFKSLKT